MLGGNLSVTNGCEKARLPFHMNTFVKFVRVASRNATISVLMADFEVCIYNMFR